MRVLNPSYEVEGRLPGQPIVKFRESVIDRLGEPHVDYDQLEELVHGDIGISTDRQIKIKMYGRTAKSMVAGFHVMYTNTAHINPMVAQAEAQGVQKEPIVEGGFMKTVFHELSHVRDSKDHPVRTMGEYALRNVVIRIGITTGSAVGAAAITPDLIDGIAPLAIPTAVYFGYYAIDPAEQRARRFEKDDRLLAKHKDAITFG